jgi:hypothetical protein
MAVIPDANSLGRRSIPQSGRGMVSVDLSAGAEGMIRAGRQVSQFGEGMQREVEKEQRDREEMEAAQADLMLKEYSVNNYDEQKQKPDDSQNYVKNFKIGFEQTRQKAASLFSNPRMAERFNAIVAPTIEFNAVSRLRDLEQSVYTEKQKVYISNGIDVAQRSLMQDSSDQNYMASTLALQKVIDGSPLSPAEKQSLSNSTRKTLTEAVLSTKSPQEIFEFSAKEINPVNIVMRNEIGPSQQIRVHSDGDGKAVGGINSVAFPTEFNEASRILDEQGQNAAREYITGFYDKMAKDRGISDLPAGVQDIVFDGVVNHAGAFQAKLIDAAKGGATRQELIDMRRAEYARLVDTGQEKYTKNAAGWENRLKGLERGMYDTDVLMRERDRAEAAAPHLVSEQVKNAAALARDGKPFTSPDPKLLQIAEKKSPGISAQADIAIRSAEDTYRMIGMSPQQTEEMLKSRKPDETDMQSYASKQEAYNRVVQASTEARKRQIEETAEAAILSDPSIANLAGSAMKSPADMQAYLGRVKKFSEDVRVPDPKLLPKSMADAIIQDFNAPETKREARLQKLQDIKALTGDYFPAIIGQIAPKTGNDLLAAATFLEGGDDLTLPMAIVNAFGERDEALQEGVTVGTKYLQGKNDASISAVLNDPTFIAEMRDVNASLRAISPSRTSDELINTINKEIVRAGFSYAKSGNMSLDAGIAAAVNQAKQNYVFSPQGGKVYDGSGAPPFAIPKAYAQSAAQIQRSADFAVTDIALSPDIKINYRQGETLPRTYVNISESIKNDAYWVRTPDGKGLALVMPTANGNTRVMSKDDKPFVLTWQQLVEYQPRVTGARAVDVKTKGKGALLLAY